MDASRHGRALEQDARVARVEFACYAPLGFGEEVVVCGDAPVLGNGAVGRGVALRNLVDLEAVGRGVNAVALLGAVVAYGYDADACRRLSEDGECLRRGTRYVEARVSVSLESQARTLEEQRRMDEGEMEQRYVDTLWVFTASAPKGAGDAALGALRRAADSFEVVVD